MDLLEFFKTISEIHQEKKVYNPTKEAVETLDGLLKDINPGDQAG